MTTKVSDYSFELPQELIAQTPSEKRSDSRLLLVRRNAKQGEPRFEDLLVSDLPELLKLPELRNSRWFRNTTKVIPARFYARRPTGSRHEFVLIEPIDADAKVWKCLIRGESSFRYPQELFPENDVDFRIRVPESRIVEFQKSPYEWLEKNGEMPLPPYIRNRDKMRDHERYQSVWANQKGSVAAPTASLHFESTLLSQMENAGASFFDLCLHVGLGTFEPLREENVEDNRLHQERLSIPKQTVEELQGGEGPRIAVGSTALRTLSSFFQKSSNPEVHLKLMENGDWAGTTQIFIKEGGTSFEGIHGLFTNFHLPESSLMIMISAFAGSRQLALEAYQHAITKKYRFFSYGDASLWL